MNRDKFLVAHNRDRDGYQIALALAEHDMLAKLVTDFYYDQSNAIHRSIFRHLLGHRQCIGLHASLVRPLPQIIILQLLAQIPALKKFDIYLQVDSVIAREIRRLALRDERMNILSYSGYAYDAFIEPKLADRRKVLFLFHPHHGLIRRILQEDYERYGVGLDSISEESGRASRTAKLDAEISLASQIICASELSRRSVEAAKLTDQRIDIVPYGSTSSSLRQRDVKNKPVGKVNFLFVGQAIQRKGLHHLLAVWKRLRLPNAYLTLVCSREQDEILSNVPDGVSVKKGLSKSELGQEFDHAHCFVLPSLVEGFGLVLLEAIQAGCFVIFSNSTGFAGQDIPADIGKEIRAGNREDLEQSIIAAYERQVRGEIDTSLAIQTANAMDGVRFRSKLRESLSNGR